MRRRSGPVRPGVRSAPTQSRRAPRAWVAPRASHPLHTALEVGEGRGREPRHPGQARKGTTREGLVRAWLMLWGPAGGCVELRPPGMHQTPKTLISAHAHILQMGKLSPVPSRSPGENVAYFYVSLSPASPSVEWDEQYLSLREY